MGKQFLLIDKSVSIYLKTVNFYIIQKYNKQTSKQTNKQANKQTINKQTNVNVFDQIQICQYCHDLNRMWTNKLVIKLSRGRLLESY